MRPFFSKSWSECADDETYPASRFYVSELFIAYCYDDGKNWEELKGGARAWESFDWTSDNVFEAKFGPNDYDMAKYLAFWFILSEQM